MRKSGEDFIIIRKGEVLKVKISVFKTHQRWLKFKINFMAQSI